MPNPTRRASATKATPTPNGVEAPVSSGEIVLQRLKRGVAYVPIEGTAILVAHRFDEKAKQQILAKHMGKAKVKEHKNPEANFMAARHRLDEKRDGIPARAFKGAIADAARYFEGLTMTDAKRMILVLGEGPDELVPIIGEARMREDYVRNETGVVDIRHRPEYFPWRAILPVVFLQGRLSIEAVVALVDAAGLGGVGEGRPASKKSLTGGWGTWKVVDENEIRVVSL